MVKSKEEVIAQFHEEVNMTVEELEAWLENPKSTEAGTGVGIESGRNIIEILKKNPTKDAEKYDEEDIEHMRKVVGYTNRHLAQEEHLKETKTREELENAKSTISLKNWGHDPVKALDEENGDSEESSADSATNGHNGRDGSAAPEAPEATVENQSQDVNANGKAEVSSEVEEKPAESKKRKLDADEPLARDGETGAAEGDASGMASGDGDDELAGEESSGALEEVGEEGGEEEEPPRKKAKNDEA